MFTFLNYQTRDRQSRFPLASRHGPEEDPEREGHLDAPLEELHGLRVQGRSADPESRHPMRLAGSHAQLVPRKSR